MYLFIFYGSKTIEQIHFIKLINTRNASFDSTKSLY